MLRFLIFFVLVSLSTCKVLELSDKFLEVYKEGRWLVKLYAPWCGHCKNLEPVWEEVSRHYQDSPLTVARIDCTRFSSVAHHFKIKGFPTLLLLKDGKEFVYNGDRTKEEIVRFVQRLTGPPVQEIDGSHEFINMKNRMDPSFLYIGDKVDLAWESFDQIAHKFQEHAYFYHTDAVTAERYVHFSKAPSIFVFKEFTNIEFPDEYLGNIHNLNETLYKWINSQRLLTFPRITRGNLSQFYLSNKYLVLAAVSEEPSSAQETLEFKNMIKSFVRLRRQTKNWDDPFQFGWTTSSELVNNVALMVVPMPSVMVINTTTSQYHVPESEEKLSAQVLESFLEQVVEGKAPAYGGNSVGVRMYRIWYELRSTLRAMWKSNPILTSVLFGLPSVFLFFICRSGICWPPADDEEEALAENEAEAEAEVEETDHKKEN